MMNSNPVLLLLINLIACVNYMSKAATKTNFKNNCMCNLWEKKIQKYILKKNTETKSYVISRYLFSVCVILMCNSPNLFSVEWCDLVCPLCGYYA